MTVFIAMRTPRICRFDLCRRGGKGNVTKPGSFATADYSLKKRPAPQSGASIVWLTPGALRFSARFCCASGRGVACIGD
jgi:hypothetical protein